MTMMMMMMITTITRGKSRQIKRNSQPDIMRSREQNAPVVQILISLTQNAKRQLKYLYNSLPCRSLVKI